MVHFNSGELRKLSDVSVAVVTTFSLPIKYFKLHLEIFLSNQLSFFL